MKRAALLIAVALVVGACSEAGESGTSAADPSETGEIEEDTMPDASDTTPPTEDGQERAESTEPPSTGSAAEDSQATTEAPPTETLELNPVKETTPVAASEGPPVGANESLYPQGQIDSGLQPFIDMATADLATRLGVATGDIQAISAVIVTWGDSSMGCPQPGMEYLQVLQDGSIIELGSGGKVYRYHSGGTLTPFLCNQPLANPPVAGGSADV